MKAIPGSKARNGKLDIETITGLLGRILSDDRRRPSAEQPKKPSYADRPFARQQTQVCCRYPFPHSVCGGSIDRGCQGRSRRIFELRPCGSVVVPCEFRSHSESVSCSLGGQLLAVRFTPSLHVES